jgi:hypothetical protein
MAQAVINLPIGAAMLPDGSAGNAGPALVRFQGTEANPKKHFLAAAFDWTVDEHLWWTFRMPPNYASAPLIKLLWMVNAVTATAVVWAGRLGAITPADADTPLEHIPATASVQFASINTIEARRVMETVITLANVDSVAIGDLVFLLIYRDADHASDTCAVDAELISAALEYTTV